MKILVACEESQAVTIELRKRGHEAYSCDLLPCSGGHPEWHLQQNVVPLLEQKWDMIVAFPPCFEPGTLVKTMEGFKRIENIVVGDYVWTHKGRYQKVYDTQKTLVNKIMNIKITSSKKFRVTEEHPFYVVEKTPRSYTYSEPKWVKAKDLNINHFIATANYYQEGHNSSTLKEFKKLQFEIEDFWWLVGKWVGDGWTLVHHGSPEVAISSSKKPQEQIEIEKRMKAVFGFYSKENQKSTFRYVIRNKELFDFLNLFGKYCEGKFIPEFMYGLAEKYIKSFLDGYFFADGYFKQDISVQEFTTVSEKLAFGLQSLILKVMQKPTTFNESKPRKKEHFIQGRKIKQLGSYNLRFQTSYKSKDIRRLHYVNIGGKIYTKFKKSIFEDYNNYVYNLSVDEDESYTVNNLICHNCTHIAVSGSRYFEQKRKDGRQQQGIDFFMLFANADCPRIAIENPIGIMSSVWRKPDQIIQPWMFGEDASKATCLWLKGLPLLKPTNIIKKDRYANQTREGQNKIMIDGKWLKYNDPRTAIHRSKTYSGVAKAMAEQWVEDLNF